MLLTNKVISQISHEAKSSPRLRMNYNLHNSFEESVQRMFNALEPGTIIPIARHRSSSETLIMIKGKLRVIIYDDNKNILENVTIAPNSENIGYHIIRC